MSKITNRQISEQLDKCNISHANSGYLYLMSGIRLILDEQVDRSRIIAMYELVATKHNVSSASVESGIRMSILKSDKKGLTNREFISRVVDTLLFDDEERGDG